MTGTKESLQAKIAACGVNAQGARQYPSALRSEILRYLDREVRRGGHFAELCEGLGVHAVLARRWRRSDRAEGFVAVTVVEDTGGDRERSVTAADRSPPVTVEAHATPHEALPARLTLTSPGGWRVEGLSAEALLALLPSLP